VTVTFIETGAKGSWGVNSYLQIWGEMGNLLIKERVYLLSKKGRGGTRSPLYYPALEGEGAKKGSAKKYGGGG